MFKTVKSKFILFSILFITLCVGIPMHFLVKQYRDNFNQRSKVMLNTTMDIFSIILDDCMMRGEKDINQIVARIARVENIHHVRIISDEKMVLYSSTLEEANKLLNTVAPGHVSPDRFLSEERTIQLLDDGRSYSAFQPILNKESCRGCHGDAKNIAFIDVDAHMTRAEVNFFTGSFHLLFLGIAGLLLLIIALYYLFNIYINKPLLSFVAAFNKVGEGNLSTRININRGDEFGIMEQRFNEMVYNLENSQYRLDELHFEELQRANRLVELGELAAEMAHEINNPAGVILTRADYLRIHSRKNEELKKYWVDLEVIVKNIEKVSAITGNILKYSRKLSKEFIKFDLVKVTNEAVQLIAPVINKKNIRFQITSNIPQIFIKGSPLQINQVVTNLLVNALDATRENDEIIISLVSNENKIYLSVTDTGKGIQEGELHRIFDPFYTTKSADKGTGLGLYIIKNICKNHDALIKCESKPNRGTTFTITFNKIENK